MPPPSRASRSRPAGFTLLEICLAVFIAILLLAAAVPSLSGVLNANKENEVFKLFNDLVQEARARSIEERRAYVLLWTKEGVTLQADGAAPDEEAQHLTLEEDDTLKLELPAALIKDPPPVWTFWPSGTCEPATVHYSGKSGRWTAAYNPFTAQPEVTHE